MENLNYGEQPKYVPISANQTSICRDGGTCSIEKRVWQYKCGTQNSVDLEVFVDQLQMNCLFLKRLSDNGAVPSHLNDGLIESVKRVEKTIVEWQENGKARLAVRGLVWHNAANDLALQVIWLEVALKIKDINQVSSKFPGSSGGQDQQPEQKKEIRQKDFREQAVEDFLKNNQNAKNLADYLEQLYLISQGLQNNEPGPLVEPVDAPIQGDAALLVDIGSSTRNSNENKLSEKEDFPKMNDFSKFWLTDAFFVLYSMYKWLREKITSGSDSSAFPISCAKQQLFFNNDANGQNHSHNTAPMAY